MKKKMLVIVNPVSGVGRQKNIESLLSSHLDHDLFDHHIVYTEHEHHGTTLTRDAADEGYDIVVAVGGDGSVNDIVQGLRGTSLALGIIPCGSGNGLARTLEIPLSPTKAIQRLGHSQARTIDAILINDKTLSVNASGVGFDAHLARLMKLAKHRGMAAYTSLFLREYTSYPSASYTITVDGQTIVRNAWIMAIANSRQYGNNLIIAPKAHVDDGLMDLSIIDKIPLDHLAITAPLAFSGHLDHSQHAEMYQARDIVVEGNVGSWVNVDGEAMKIDAPLRFAIQPGAITIM